MRPPFATGSLCIAQDVSIVSEGEGFVNLEKTAFDFRQSDDFCANGGKGLDFLRNMRQNVCKAHNLCTAFLTGKDASP